MTFDLIQRSLAIAGLTALVACGGGDGVKKDAEATSELTEVAATGSENFNLARFLRTNPNSASFKTQIEAGDSSLFFGEKNKFRVDSNLTLDTIGTKNYFFGGPRGITAAYWLDGYVFGKRLGTNKGFILDIGSEGDLETISIAAHIRFLGIEQYNSRVALTLDKFFVRDLNVDGVYYPLPMLGVRVNGNIGGEMGLHAELASKQPNSMSMVFQPKTAVVAGLSGGVEVLNFASAKVSGVVELLAIELASTANLGYVKEANYSYGHTGVDGGQIRAMDGLLEVLAKASVKGMLPGGVDNKLWKAVRYVLGVDDAGWEWRHTVWDPEPWKAQDLPAYGNSFMNFAKIPESLGDCTTKVAAIQKVLDTHILDLFKHNRDLKGITAQLNTQSQKYLAEIKTKVASYCKKY